MKNIGIILIAIGVLTGCKGSDKILAECENGLKTLLKSPRTYQLADKKIHTDENSRRITVEFDAQNGYGALMRGTFSCDFKRDKTGNFELIGAALNHRYLDESEFLGMVSDIARSR
ncbi:hypothetical protein [Paremcibacter congregatus]|uniref:hypothetical protein n=1 Tax=Paremcibacter congregatus TaxID=2043170 RepID=UPI0030EF61AD|tara:strand:- start:4337 stop:4684 length:348 start_codon:yes stop_codon:yes gene_type:complete